ncbi:MAG: cache domain-containing protein [Deltaproteobacteria bacterium]|nr:cache domain-containing protein [Candidatus Anaeroferrophillacea bacterium]
MGDKEEVFCAGSSGWSGWVPGVLRAATVMGGGCIIQLLRRVILVCVPDFLVLTLMVMPAPGSEIAPQMVVDHVDRAVQLVVDQGPEKTFPQLIGPHGSWVKGELYVFVYDFSGTIVAHLNSKLVGKNLLKVKDVKGNVFTANFIAAARGGRGEGWTEYWWPKPGEKEPSLKASFIKRVPDRELLLGVGAYGFSKVQAEHATGR